MSLPTPRIDTVEDFLTSQAHLLLNQGRWNAHEEITKWLIECCLDVFLHLIANISDDDHKKLSQLQRFGRNAQGAVDNLLHLAVTS